jgi:Co/Zn/Cd efflux system component
LANKEERAMSAPTQTLQHEHVFLGEDHDRNTRRIWLVIALTAAMMVAEIAAGSWYGSMALVADGWHMSTHASAMLISAVAYLYARKQAHNPRFTFGTGKLGDLAGFASAIILALIALLMAYESLLRIVNPVPISFSQAIGVAVLGLAVNVVSAWLLKDDHHTATIMVIITLRRRAANPTPVMHTAITLTTVGTRTSRFTATTPIMAIMPTATMAATPLAPPTTTCARPTSMSSPMR